MDGFDDPGGCLIAILALIGIALFVVFMIFVGAPLLVFLAETVWGLLVLLAGIAGRILFGRPWIVEARSSAGAVARWPVRGWAKSHRAIEEIATRLAAGATPPFDLPSRTDGRPRT